MNSQGVVAQSPSFISSGAQAFIAPQLQQPIQVTAAATAATAAVVAPTAPVPPTSGLVVPFYPHNGTTQMSLSSPLSGGNNSTNNGVSSSNSMVSNHRSDDSSSFRLFHAATDNMARGVSRTGTPAQTSGEKQAMAAAAAAAASAAGVASAVTGGWFIGEPGEGEAEGDTAGQPVMIAVQLSPQELAERREQVCNEALRQHAVLQALRAKHAGKRGRYKWVFLVCCRVLCCRGRCRRWFRLGGGCFLLLPGRGCRCRRECLNFFGGALFLQRLFALWFLHERRRG